MTSSESLNHISWADAERFGLAEGMQDRGRAFDVGSCSHIDLDHPKYSVAQVVGFMKGKSAISIARTYIGRRKNFTGQSFWARGYYVSTVGRGEAVVRNYIRHQEEEDKRIEQLDLF